MTMPLPGISSALADLSPRGSSFGTISSKCDFPSEPA
jgi:hypothetical protein